MNIKDPQRGHQHVILYDVPIEVWTRFAQKSRDEIMPEKGEEAPMAVLSEVIASASEGDTKTLIISDIPREYWDAMNAEADKYSLNLEQFIAKMMESAKDGKALVILNDFTNDEWNKYAALVKKNFDMTGDGLLNGVVRSVSLGDMFFYIDGVSIDDWATFSKRVQEQFKFGGVDLLRMMIKTIADGTANLSNNPLTGAMGAGTAGGAGGDPVAQQAAKNADELAKKVKAKVNQ